jgi:hypothetical protein
MNYSISPCGFALCLSLSLSIALGCKSSTPAAEQNSGPISPGAPTFNEQFQTRNPRVCSKVTSAPTVAQAALMVQCDFESNSNAGGTTPIFFLATDVTVEMGSPRTYTVADSFLADIDPSGKIYPLHGQATAWTCNEVNPYNAGKNCFMSPGDGKGSGYCWHTSFNAWRCTMTMGGSDRVMNVKGPTTF